MDWKELAKIIEPPEPSIKERQEKAAEFLRQQMQQRHNPSRVKIKWNYDHPSNKPLKEWLLTQSHVRKDGVREQSRVSED